MRRLVGAAVLLLAAGGLALLLLPEAPPPPGPLRQAPKVPAPTPDQRIAYFYGVLRDGASTDLAAPTGGSRIQIPVWREIGWTALLSLGQPALEYLTAPERFPEYVTAPNLLSTVLQLLAEAPPFPGLVPFLEHWLDERNCPLAAPGSNWPEEIRLLVFAALKAHPVAEAAPLCHAELARPPGLRDLRGPAIDVLLRLGQADELNQLFATLPPTPAQPEPDLRAGILDRLFQMAAPTAGARSQGQVEALEPLLREALKSPRPIERYSAMGALWRLGRPGMELELQRFFEDHRDDENLSWSALLLLAHDGPSDFVKDRCLRRVENADKGTGFITAVRILARWWIAETEPKLLHWIGKGDIDAYMVLQGLLRQDRAVVLTFLRGELRGGDVLRALRFIEGEQVTELVPDILARVREVEPSQRPPYYDALVELKAPGTEALLLAELSAPISDQLKNAAAYELLRLGGADGIARIAKLVSEGDTVALDAVFRRARAFGAAGVPDPLAPALLVALRKMPGEDGRRAALWALRFRGRLDDVRTGLIEAYRYEPSRRVAKEIGQALDELAHR